MPTASSTKPNVKSSPAPETEFEFSDVSTLMCLLCARQFKTLEVLKRHNKESDLHKVCKWRSLVLHKLTDDIQKNHKDSNLREVAKQKVAARKAGPPTDLPKYRDRASERRTLFNQPDMPLPDKDVVSKKRQADMITPTVPVPPVAPPELGKDESNVGNKLLKIMGWKEGTGLGSEADGRVNPMYVISPFSTIQKLTSPSLAKLPYTPPGSA